MIPIGLSPRCSSGLAQTPLVSRGTRAQGGLLWPAGMRILISYLHPSMSIAWEHGAFSLLGQSRQLQQQLQHRFICQPHRFEWVAGYEVVGT
mmetsp:Transcript_7379/g.18367  ORF Transcript_7379/g.18367 Transcript_7379/m.18367 type:complete len:92 (-) Transcript_7379:202-477(-)